MSLSKVICKTLWCLHQGQNHNTIENCLSTKLLFSISKILNHKLPSWLRQFLGKKICNVGLSTDLRKFNYIISHWFLTNVIINILVILLNSRLWQHSILLYRLIITKNTFWPICCNQKHAKCMPEFLYHINSHAHSTEFRTNFTGLKFVMFITIPIDWCLVTKHKDTSINAYIIISPWNHPQMRRLPYD